MTHLIVIVSSGAILPDSNAVVRQIFDLEVIPEALQTEDSIQQEDVLSEIFKARQYQTGQGRTFEKEQVFNVKISTLRRSYEKKDSHYAINLMRRRVRVELDARSTADSRDDDLMWHCTNFFLDYLMLVSADIGLHAILPNVQSDPGYNFRLQLNQPYRTFSAKFAKLGFDPKGRMLFIGFQGIDNVWLAMAPRRALRPDGEDIPVGTCTGPTMMATEHYLAMLAWLSHTLQETAISDVFLSVPYPDISSTFKFKIDSNIL
jgi:hypothetical protein